MNKQLTLVLIALLTTYYLWMLFTPYSQDSVEGIVLAHQRSSYPNTIEESRERAHIPLYGRLYYSLTETPDASLFQGRLLSLIALVSIGFLLSWSTEKKLRLQLLLFLLLQAPLLRFAIVNRVDLLAISVAIIAFILYHKWKTTLTIQRTTTIVLILVAGFYLKQTAIVSVSLIICIDLWRQKKYSHLFLGGTFMSALMLIPMIHNPLLWVFMVESNVNTINMANWLSNLVYLIPFFIVAIIGLRATHSSLVKSYLSVALVVALCTAMKSGANLNYFIEPAVLLALLFSTSKVFTTKATVLCTILLVGALPVIGQSIWSLKQCKSVVERYQFLDKNATILAPNCTPILIAQRKVAIVDLHIAKQLWSSSLVDTTVLLEKVQSADYVELESRDSIFIPLSILQCSQEVSHD